MVSSVRPTPPVQAAMCYNFRKLVELPHNLSRAGVWGQELLGEQCLGNYHFMLTKVRAGPRAVRG